MFTGIVTAKAKILRAIADKNGMVLALKKPKRWKLKIGQSLAVNGVCSTIKKAGNEIVFEYMPESLRRTSLKTLATGGLVNLEQSLRVSDRLDGHIVQGHVDTAGEIYKIIPEGNSYIFFIKIKSKNGVRLLVEKGAVALDGISLTVVKVKKNIFTVKIIPYTWDNTNFGRKKIGDKVNIEFDILAKYTEKLLKFNRRYANKK